MKLHTPLLSALLVASISYAEEVKQPFSPYADREYPTKLLFGEQHMHTALSADAGGGGTKLLPRDAYRFAKGEQVLSNTNQPVQRNRPLDFMCITEHTDGMGAITDILKGTPNIMNDKQGAELHKRFALGGEEARRASQDLIKWFAQGEISPALNYQPGNPDYKRTWESLVQAAEEYNEPHHFTAMIAYEWTSLVKGNNLHRNVILRDGAERALQVLPFTMTPPMGSPNPRDLWKWLEDYEAKTGGQAIAIPHNGNLSNGIMYSMKDDFNNGAKFDKAYVTARAKWEKLMEISQAKGDGETHPKLSPDDEFADYETWEHGNLDLTAKKTDAMLPFEYARSTLKNGLTLEDELGVNPFKYGFVSGSDHHTAMSTGMDNNYFGAFTWGEPNPYRIITKDKKFSIGKYNPKLEIGYDTWQYASPGPTAVWATSNTRAGIFDAMKRKKVGFLIRALRDPEGANLDRVQVVKGWLDKSGATHEKVYDVVWSGERKVAKDGKLPSVGDTVDLSIPTWTNTIGSAQLATFWEDPDFDATQQSFYYLRVIEIPTPRWTAYDMVRYNIKDIPKNVKLKTQERAYTSPIWYTPSK